MIAHIQLLECMLSMLLLPFKMWGAVLSLPFPWNLYAAGLLSGHLLSSMFLTLVIMVNLKDWAERSTKP